MAEELKVKGTAEKRAPTPNDVVYRGEIIGTNTDPRIRGTIMRDAQAADDDLTPKPVEPPNEGRPIRQPERAAAARGHAPARKR